MKSAVRVGLLLALTPALWRRQNLNSCNLILFKSEIGIKQLRSGGEGTGILQPFVP